MWHTYKHFPNITAEKSSNPFPNHKHTTTAHLYVLNARNHVAAQKKNALANCTE